MAEAVWSEARENPELRSLGVLAAIVWLLQMADALSCLRLVGDRKSVV